MTNALLPQKSNPLNSPMVQPSKKAIAEYEKRTNRITAYEFLYGEKPDAYDNLPPVPEGQTSAYDVLFPEGDPLKGKFVGHADMPQDYREKLWRDQGKITAGENLGRMDLAEKIPAVGKLWSADKLLRLHDAVSHVKEGAAFPLEKGMVRSFIMEMEERAVRGTTLGADITEVVSEMPAFMIEFILAGGLAKMGTKSAVKLGKGMLVKAIKRGVKKGVKRGVIKTGTRIAGATGNALLRTAAMPQRAAELYVEQRLPQGMHIAADGHVVIDKDGEAPWTSFLKATGLLFIENLSEISGPALGRVGKRIASRIPGAKRFRKAFAGRLGKAWVKLAPGRTRQMFYKRLGTVTGYHGILEEIGEERVGDILRAVTNLDDFGAGKDSTMVERLQAAVPDQKQLLTELGAFSVPGAAFAPLGVAANVRDYRRATGGGRFTPEQADILDKAGVPHDEIRTKITDDEYTQIEDIVTLVEDMQKAETPAEAPEATDQITPETPNETGAPEEWFDESDELNDMAEIDYSDIDEMPGEDVLAELEDEEAEPSEDEYAAEYGAMLEEDAAAKGDVIPDETDTQEDVTEPVEEEPQPEGPPDQVQSAEVPEDEAEGESLPDLTPLGTQQVVVGQESKLIGHARSEDDIDYELWEGDTQSSIRMVDADSGEVITLNTGEKEYIRQAFEDSVYKDTGKAPVTSYVTDEQKGATEGRRIRLKKKIRQRQERNLAKIQSTRQKKTQGKAPDNVDIAEQYQLDKSDDFLTAWDNKVIRETSVRVANVARQIGKQPWMSHNERIPFLGDARDVGSSIKWLIDHGYVQRAWDHNGDVYYANTGEALPYWLTRSGSDEVMTALKPRPRKKSRSQKKPQPRKKPATSSDRSKKSQPQEQPSVERPKPENTQDKTRGQEEDVSPGGLYRGIVKIEPDESLRTFAESACRGISMDPESMGKRIITDYVNTLKEITDDLLKFANSEEQKTILRIEMAQFVQRYTRKFREMLGAKSRTLSPMVTGPSKFPTRRNQKRLDTESRRLHELEDVERKGRKSIERKVVAAKTAEEAEAEDIAGMKKDVVSLVNIYNGTTPVEDVGLTPNSFKQNLVTRWRKYAKSYSPEVMREALAYLEQRQTADLQKPIFSKKHSIWKLAEKAEEAAEQRDAELAEIAARPDEEVVAEYDGVTIVRNNYEDRIQILFDTKPGQEMIADLRGAAWRWSPTNKAWQRKITNGAIASSKNLVGRHYTAAPVQDVSTDTETPPEHVTNRQRVAEQIASEFPTGSRGVDTHLALHDAIAAHLVADGKIEDADDYYADLWVGQYDPQKQQKTSESNKPSPSNASAKKEAPQTVDMFGRPVAKKLTGEQRHPGIDEGRTEASRTPAKAELVKEIARQISAGQKPKTAKDAYIAILAKYKGDSNKLFNNPTDPMSEMEQAFIEATKGGILFQGERGSYQLKDGISVIRAFKTADQSTIAHEMGHYLRRMMSRYYSEDTAVLEQYYGVKQGKWTVAQEEAFARSWERYLRNGKAPTRALQDVFNQFKIWLTRIYENLKAIIHPDGKKRPHPLALASLGLTQKQWKTTTLIFDKWLGKKITLKRLLENQEADADRKASRRQARPLRIEIVNYGQANFDFLSPSDMLNPADNKEQYGASDIGFDGFFANDLPGEVTDVLNGMSSGERLRYRKIIKANQPHGMAEDYIAEAGSDAWWAQAKMIVGGEKGESKFYIEHARQTAVDEENFSIQAAVSMLEDLELSEVPFDDVAAERENRERELIDNRWHGQEDTARDRNEGLLWLERENLQDELDNLSGVLEYQDTGPDVDRIDEIEERLRVIKGLIGEEQDLDKNGPPMFQKSPNGIDADVMAQILIRSQNSKQQRADARKIFRLGRLAQASTIADMIDFAMKLPKEQARQAMRSLKRVKSQKAGVKSFIARVNTLLAQAEHRAAIDAYKQAMPSDTEIQHLHPSYRDVLSDLKGNYDLHKMRARTKRTLEAMNDWMEKQQQSGQIPMTPAALERMRASVSRLEKTPLAELSTEDIYRVIQTVQRYTSQAKLITELKAKGRHREDAGAFVRMTQDLQQIKQRVTATIEAVLERPGRGLALRAKKKAFRIAGILLSAMHRGRLDGYNLADMMGPTMLKYAYEGPMDGMRQHARIVQRQQDDLRKRLEALGMKWGRNKLLTTATDQLDIKFNDGTTRKMTVMEVVPLLAYLEQDYTIEQIEAGKVDFRIEGEKTHGESFKVSMADLDLIREQVPLAYAIMTAIRDNIEIMKNEMNDASVENEGFEKFTAAEYFPVVTLEESRTEVKTEVLQEWAQALPENLGFNQLRIGRSGTILLRNGFTTWAKHIHGGASYVAMTQHIRRLMILTGHRDIKKLIDQKMGSSMRKGFIDRRIKAMTLMASMPPTTFDSIIKSGTHHLVTAFLSWNPSPALKQFAGLATMLTEVGSDPIEAWHYLARYGLPAVTQKEMWMLMLKHAPLIRERIDSLGSAFVSPESGEGRKLLGDRGWRENGMEGLVWADAVNGVAAFGVFVEQVRREGHLEGEDLYEEAGRRAERAVSLTQNAVNPMDHSDWGLQGRRSGVLRLVLIFKSEPNKKFNVMVRALRRYAKSKRTIADKATLLHNMIFTQFLSTTIAWGVKIGLIKGVMAMMGGDDDDRDLADDLGAFIIGEAAEMVGVGEFSYQGRRLVGHALTNRGSRPPRGHGTAIQDACEEILRSLWATINAYKEKDLHGRKSYFQSGYRKGLKKSTEHAFDAFFAAYKGLSMFTGLPHYPVRLADKWLEHQRRE
ncbi:MAG: hypothetical protein U9Q07_07615 [Planctomycetota bacterium]|nr:hypothetical protein [Planctomycetota bacterium]